MRTRITTVACILFIIILVPATRPAAANPGAQAGERCFPETGACLAGPFLRFWEQHGGLAVFGYPIAPAADEVSADDGRVYRVQWLERARFELHPENPPPYDVLLGRLGDAVLRNRGVDWTSIPGQQNIPTDCRGFATRHNLCNSAVVGRDISVVTGFRDYWETYGLTDPARDAAARSLALLGMPLTDPLVETNSSGVTVLAQYFERARLERVLTVSPDGTQVEVGPTVLQGRLGAELQTSSLPVQTLATRVSATHVPFTVVADEQGVLWSTVADGAGLIVVADAGGGNQRTLASDPDGIKELIADDTYVYWIANTGLRRVPRAGGAAETLAAFDGAAAYGLTSDQEFLYWVQPDRNLHSSSLVITLPLSGGEPRPISGDIWDIQALAADGQHVYWANSHLELKRAPRTGGTPEFVYATRGAARAARLVLAGDTVYAAYDGVSVRDLPQANGLVVAVTKGDRSAAQVIETTRTLGLAVDTERLYWSTASGAIRAAPLNGGPPVTLVAGQSQPGSLAVNNQGLFWANLQPVAAAGGSSVSAILHAPDQEE